MVGKDAKVMKIQLKVYSFTFSKAFQEARLESISSLCLISLLCNINYSYTCLDFLALYSMI